jgi:hypothetical protein
MTWEQQEVFRILKNKPGTTYQEADDANKAIIRDWVKSLAQATEIKIEFLKADGTVREMRCTLDFDRIPQDKLPKPTAVPVDGIVKESKQRKQPDEHSLRVFDLDKSEWRSFRFDRLQKVGAEISLETK